MDFTNMTAEQILALGKPPQELEDALKTHRKYDFDWSNPTKALATLRQFVELMEKADEMDLEVQEDTVHAPARDGTSLPIKILRSADSSTERGPLIVLYFPGGFVFGSNITMAPLARLLVKRFGAVVALPTYRLAPEHPFPTGFDDSWDALSWIAANMTCVLGADHTKGFVVGGISSGSNISNVVAHLARDNALHPPITGLWLSCGGVRLAPLDQEQLLVEYRDRLLSRTQDECLNNAITSPEMAKWMTSFLQPDENSHTYAPLTWSTGHRKLPKTYFQVCGMDPARDETLVFDDILKKEGIATRVDLYPGLPHVFWHQFKDLPQAKKWETDTISGLAWLLET